MKIEHYTLSNGIRVVFLPTKGAVTYAGMGIRSGTRHETEGIEGIAHFVEHMLFKGTTRRKAWHILNRMEAIGGELNAFTTKEDTFIYTIAPKGEIGRSMELIGDICFRSTFPVHELERERTVVMDEINVYKDTPGEQIFDDFEALLFPGHPLGRRILGTKESLLKMTREDCVRYVRDNFTPDRMLFFCMGPTNLKRIIELGERHFDPFASLSAISLQAPQKLLTPSLHEVERGSYQSHVVLGGMGPDMYDKERQSASVLMNILGGPGMNSRLNVALREKRGWVYNVEASLTGLSDAGYWQIYFGCDPGYRKRALNLVHQILDELMQNKLSPARLQAALKQTAGQLSISAEQTEQTFLSLGKLSLYDKEFEPLEVIIDKIRAITAEQIQAAAQRMFDKNNRLALVYNGSEQTE